METKGSILMPAQPRIKEKTGLAEDPLVEFPGLDPILGRMTWKNRASSFLSLDLPLLAMSGWSNPELVPPPRPNPLRPRSMEL